MIESVHRFAAMGSECTITITAPDVGSAQRSAEQAETTVRQLEALWSRFRPDSELMVLNAGAGSAIGVSPDTFALIGAAVDAWRLTGCLFDPTLLDALRGAGYDRSFEQLAAASPGAAVIPGSADADAGAGAGDPSPSGVLPTEIRFDDETFFVTLPAAMQLDLGGIGKGRAADIVAASLERTGVPGGCVDLGGDMVVFGARAADEPWAVAVDDPAHPGTDLALLVLDRGAVATSSRARRRWTTPAGAAHHLIDPRTGRPAVSDLLAVTVVAAEAMWAEVHAKAALIAGSEAGTELLERAGLSALFVTEDARLLPVGGIDGFLLPTGTSL